MSYKVPVKECHQLNFYRHDTRMDSPVHHRNSIAHVSSFQSIGSIVSVIQLSCVKSVGRTRINSTTLQYTHSYHIGNATSAKDAGISYIM